MSRPNITDDIVSGLEFARACVLDQRTASHNQGNRRWDQHYRDALKALDAVINHHKKAK